MYCQLRWRVPAGGGHLYTEQGGGKMILSWLQYIYYLLKIFHIAIPIVT